MKLTKQLLKKLVVEALREQKETVRINKDNWSGESADLNIDYDAMTFNVYNHLFKLVALESDEPTVPGIYGYSIESADGSWKYSLGTIYLDDFQTAPNYKPDRSVYSRAAQYLYNRI